MAVAGMDADGHDDVYYDAFEALVPTVPSLNGAAAVESVLSNMDILKLLFAQLDLPDLCRVSSVCKTWRTVSCADEFWRDVSFEGRLAYCSQARATSRVSEPACGLSRPPDAKLSCVGSLLRNL